MRGKHLFNPANFGVIFALVLLPGTWVSPGQWGQDIAFAGWIVALGQSSHRARRADISWTFLAFYSARSRCALMARAARAVWTHQLENGALLLFAFFMISDPKTNPDQSPRTRGACGDRRGDRLPLAVPALPDQRNALGVVPRGAVRSAVGLALAGAEI